MIVRPATEDDLDGLLVLYGNFGSAPLLQPREEAIHGLRRILADEKLTLIVLEDQGELLATCYLNIVPNLTHGGRPYAMIENVTSHADHRGKGLARSVLHFAQEEARRQGCYKVMLMTGNPDLVAFYEKCGFKAGQKHALQVRLP